MEVPDSPVLSSCKKGIKRHNDLIGSPILSSKKTALCADDRTSPVLSSSNSNKRMRKRRPSASPVFLRASYSRKRLDESPRIDCYFSPTRHNLPGNSLFKPKSLFAGDIVSPGSSQELSTSSQTTGCQVIEDSVSEDECSDENLNILDRTFSDEDINVSDIRSSSCNGSSGITQNSSFLSLCCTPPKRSQKKSSASACSGSSRKKGNLVPNGMAQQLTRLIARQETDYRLWRFQLKLNAIDDEEKASGALVVRIVHAQPGEVHRFAECKLVTGNAGAEDVCLLFTNERWEKLNLRAGDVVSINEPWQSVLLDERRPRLLLVLAFNLIRKRGSGGELLSNPRIEDTAPRRPCSSSSADNVAATAAIAAAAAENKRPSTVVLQAWTCTRQGCPCHFRSAP